MSDNVYVNAEKTAVVSEFDPGKKWQMPRKEAIRLGLIPDGEPKVQARRTESRPVTTESVPEDRQRPLSTPLSKPKAAKK